MQYLTLATLGNTQDFGDLTQAKEGSTGTNSPTRGLFAGGTTPTHLSEIDFIQIMTLGNAQDFGDRTIAKYSPGSTSNGHGGLG